MPATLTLDLRRSAFLNLLGSDTIPPTANLEAHYKYDTGITTSGSLVEQWADQSGNGRHLNSPSSGQQPTLSTSNAILTSVGQQLDTAEWSPYIYQPYTMYMLFRQDDYTSGNTRILDGASWFVVRQRQIEPPSYGNPFELDYYGGTAWSEPITGATSGAYHAVAFVSNGSNSLSQVGSSGSSNIHAGIGASSFIPAFCLHGVWGGNDPAYQKADILYKEVLVYSVAHDAATRTAILQYLEGFA